MAATCQRAELKFFPEPQEAARFPSEALSQVQNHPGWLVFLGAPPGALPFLLLANPMELRDFGVQGVGNGGG